jgi:serine/threonine protein kinase
MSLQDEEAFQTHSFRQHVGFACGCNYAPIAIVCIYILVIIALSVRFADAFGFWLQAQAVVEITVLLVAVIVVVAAHKGIAKHNLARAIVHMLAVVLPFLRTIAMIAELAQSDCDDTYDPAICMNNPWNGQKLVIFSVIVPTCLGIVVSLPFCYIVLALVSQLSLISSLLVYEHHVERPVFVGEVFSLAGLGVVSASVIFLLMVSWSHEAMARAIFRLQQEKEQRLRKLAEEATHLFEAERAKPLWHIFEEDIKCVHTRLPFKDCECGKTVFLGTGSFGTVQHALWHGVEVAIKRRKLLKNEGKMEMLQAQTPSNTLIKEMEAMSRLRHPNITLFLGATVTSESIIVTEYAARGSLDKLLATKWTTVMCRFDKQLTWSLHLSFGFQVALGLNHAHMCDFVHGDIKSANVLLTDRLQVKIADFGLARWKSETKLPSFETLSHDGVRTRTRTQSQTGGSLLWAAPEMFRGDPATKETDIYAFGVVMWELVTSELPYEDQSIEQIARLVMVNKLRPSTDIHTDHVPAEFMQTMRACWSQDPLDRPTMETVVELLRWLLHGQADGEPQPVLQTGRKTGEQPQPVLQTGKKTGAQPAWMQKRRETDEQPAWMQKMLSEIIAIMQLKQSVLQTGRKSSEQPQSVLQTGRPRRVSRGGEEKTETVDGEEVWYCDMCGTANGTCESECLGCYAPQLFPSPPTDDVDESAHTFPADTASRAIGGGVNGVGDGDGIAGGNAGARALASASAARHKTLGFLPFVLQEVISELPQGPNAHPRRRSQSL